MTLGVGVARRPARPGARQQRPAEPRSARSSCSPRCSWSTGSAGSRSPATTTWRSTNAWRVWDVERLLRLPDEETLQHWALQWPDLLKAANWYYVGVHFPLTAAFLAWGWLRRPPAEYRWARG